MRRSGSILAFASLLALTFALDGTSAGAADQHHRHGAHVHGVGRLGVAIAGPEVHLELLTPAGDLVGFEHPPVSESEHAALASAVARLKDGARLFRLAPAAGCRLREVVLESPLLGVAETSTRTGADPDTDRSTVHADLHAGYRFDCAAPGALSRIEVGLFESFPALQRLEVQLVTDRSQTSATLTAVRPVLEF